MSTRSGKTRLRFDHTETDQDAGGQCRVKVTLALGQLLFTADSADTADGNGPLRAAAAATLKALQEAAANKFACLLSDLDHVNALGKDLIAVLVDVEFQGRVNQVFGSCQIAGSEIDCAVKAALNATNRMFELAMRGE
ncbi:MAG: hypothetical protein AABO57_25370 [Acidobacteriota bacterium]